MAIIFGKRSVDTAACGACGRRACNLGVTNVKWAKPRDIMWVCKSCITPKKWNRIYSMSQNKLDDVEEISIAISIHKQVEYYATAFLEVLHAKNIFDIRELDEKSFESVCQEMKKGGHLIEPSRRFLLEFSNQLKLWNP